LKFRFDKDGKRVSAQADFDGEVIRFEVVPRAGVQAAYCLLSKSAEREYGCGFLLS